MTEPVRCIVHIGHGKTGTTAIQRFCHLNRAALAAEGIYYPPGAKHGWIGSLASDDPCEYRPNRPLWAKGEDFIRQRDEGLLAELEEAIRSGSYNTLIFSNEAFFRMSLGDVERLYSLATRFSARQTVVCYFREPVSYACSVLGQIAVAGRITDVATEEPSVLILPHADLVPNYVSVFGRQNIVARPFDRREFEGGDVVGDFFSVIGHPLDGWDTPPTVKPAVENPARSLEAALVATAIARQFEEMAQPLPGYEFARRYKSTLLGISGHPIRLTKAQLEHVRTASARHTRYLENEFALKLHADKKAAARVADPISADVVAQYAKFTKVIWHSDSARQDQYDAMKVMQESWSWRITAPLRAVADVVRRMFRCGG